MNSHPSPTLHRARGSAFLTVIIFTTVMVVVVASILGWSLTERRLNVRTVYWLEARNAAEALCEYGASQVVFINNNNANPASLDPYGTNPLQLPTYPGSANLFFKPNGSSAESHIDTNPLSATDPYGLELIGSPKIPINGGNLVLVNANIASNANDPLKGQYVAVNDYQIIATATAKPGNGDAPVTACVTETLSIRGAPLFANAIFYANNDLEIFPGPTMNITGPVHVNGNMFVNSGSSSLNFNGAVTVSGNFYHAWDDINTSGMGTGNEKIQTNPITFTNNAGTAVNMITSTSGTGTWVDSTMGADSALFNSTANAISSAAGPLIATNSAGVATGQLNSLVTTNFNTTAQNMWNGNLETGAMGAVAYNPVGLTLPVDSSNDLPNTLAAETSNSDLHIVTPATTTTAATTAAGNVSYMNDPPNVSLASDSTSTPDVAGKTAIEQQKFSTQANLYVLVQVSPGSSGGADTATISLYGPPSTTSPLSAGPHPVGPNGGVLLGTVPAGLVGFVPYQATQPGQTVTPSAATTLATTGTNSGAATSVSTTVSSPTTPSVTVTQSGTKYKYSYASFTTPYTYTYHYTYTYSVKQKVQNQITTQPVTAAANGSGSTSIATTGSATTTNSGTSTSTTLTYSGSGTGSGSGTYADSSGSSGFTFTSSAAALTAGSSAITSEVSSNNSAAATSASSAATTAGSSAALSAATSSQSGAVTSGTSTSTGTPSTTLTGSGAVVAQGIYDQREQSGVDLVQIDMGALNKALTDINTSTNNANAIKDSSNNLWGANTAGTGNNNGWNGGIYVDVEAPSGSHASVGIANGQTTGSGSSMIPNGSSAVNSVQGLTIATNAPMYVEGHFNADGNSSTGNSTTPDDSLTNSSSAEVPVALVADALTILSPQYFGADGSGNPVFPTSSSTNPTSANAYKSLATPDPTASGSAEVAAAMITGLVPTGVTGADATGTDGSSGGAHNLPRFLENWGGQTVTIRGSLVSLYDSKVANHLWDGTSAAYYSPPNRNWGFDQIFKNGAFPPMTPHTVVFRRVSFNDLSVSGYTAQRTDATDGWPSRASNFSTLK